MLKLLALCALIVLFYLLGKSADLVVLSLRNLGKELGIRLSFLGIILGVFTSAPELALGVNSILKGVGSVSTGNFLGGIVVILGLVLGLSVILNRTIANDAAVPLPLILGYLLLPFVLGLDGSFGKIDGAILVTTYFSVLYLLYRRDSDREHLGVEVINKRHSLRHIFFIGPGLVLLVIISDVIIRLTEFIISGLGISLFFIGLVLYSLGTNLPELIVTVRAWRNGAQELSYSNALGSAMANVLGIGLLSFLTPLAVGTGETYYALMAIVLALFVCLAIFNRTGRQLVRAEGAVLVALYALFLITQLVLGL